MLLQIMPTPASAFDGTSTVFVDSDDEGEGVSITSSESTGFVLGFIDTPIKPSELRDATIDALGGSPVFHPILTEPPPVATCAGCQAQMSLLAQLYAPVSSAQTGNTIDKRSDWHRAIYIFACLLKSCQRKEGRFVFLLYVSLDVV